MAKPDALPLMAQEQQQQQQQQHQVDQKHKDDEPCTHGRPQGAAGTLASVCYAFGALSLVASLVTAWLYGGVMDFSPAYAREELAMHFENGMMMLIPAMMLEGAQVLSASRAGALRNCYDQSVACVVMFGVKFCCYSTMLAFHGGVVHRNMRSPDARPVYTIRYIDWALAVPALVGMSSFAFDSEKWPLKVERIASLLWGAFCFPIACWVGQITPNGAAGWALITISLVGYALQSVQQAMVVQERRAHTRHSQFKVAALVCLELYTACYGVTLLLGNAGLISPLSEQMFYTYGDVLLKTMQAAVLLIIRNWDELGRVEATLRNEVDRGKEDMANFFKRASVPIVCLSNEGVVLGWNQQMADLTSIDEEVAQGKLLAEFVAQGCRADLESALQACNSNQSTGSVELKLTLPAQPEATASTVTMNFIAQLGSDSASGSIVGVGQDLTELIASKALQERRSRFAAVVSHELRSPLHGITGLSRAMAEAATNDIEKKQLGMINGCANRLLDLVSNIMDMSAVDKESEAGLERQVTVNLLDILDEVMSMMREAVDKSGKRMLKSSVSLQNNMTMQSFPAVVGDPYKCTQLFYNLVVNACKFTKEGSVAVSARRCGAFVEVDVADSGCGIGPEALGRIFKPFEQETSSDSRGFQGVGLGLSVAQGIVKLHQGEIKVQSEKGVGSTFTVRLPCQKEEVSRQYPTEEEPSAGAEAAQKAAAEGALQRHPGKEKPAADADAAQKPARSQAPQDQVQSQSPLQPASGAPGRMEPDMVRSRNSHQVDSVPTMSDVMSEVSRHLTLSALPTLPPGENPLVLSVDDDEVNHIVLERHLGQKYRIIKAMDGMEAIEYLKSDQERPSLVLLDIMMPGMTGFEVVKEIRTSLNLGHFILPVVMLSARSPPDESMLQAFHCGATDYMSKPFSAKVLNHRLSVCMSVRRDCLSLYAHVQREARCDEDDEELAQAREDVLTLQDELARLRGDADAKLERVGEELKVQHAAAVAAEQARVEELQSELTQSRAEAVAAAAERARVQQLKGELATTRAELETLRAQAQARQLEPQPALGPAYERTWASLSECSVPGSGGGGLRGMDSSAALHPLSACAETVGSTNSSIAREARWLRHELELAQESVGRLSATLAQREAEAWMHQHRSNCSVREASFLKEELHRARRFMEASAEHFVMD